MTGKDEMMTNSERSLGIGLCSPDQTFVGDIIHRGKADGYHLIKSS